LIPGTGWALFLKQPPRSEIVQSNRFYFNSSITLMSINFTVSMNGPRFCLLGSLGAYQSLGMRKSHRHLPMARDASRTLITSRGAISGEHVNTYPSIPPDSRNSTSSHISGLNRMTHPFSALYRTQNLPRCA
jgi:hypothetical protein